MILQFSLGVVFSVITLFIPAEVYAKLRDPWIWITMVCTGYLLFCMRRIIFLQKDHAVQVAVLTVMFAMMVGNESLYYDRLTEIRVSSWVFLIVAVTSVFFLGAKVRALMDAAILCSAALTIDTSRVAEIAKTIEAERRCDEGKFIHLQQLWESELIAVRLELAQYFGTEIVG